MLLELLLQFCNLFGDFSVSRIHLRKVVDVLLIVFGDNDVLADILHFLLNDLK
jgi:hypothetical protein